ncbi:unnamed protein product [Didymodactylos carnosus]|uniref:Uncharacterized protein n=1 Tax=Didymodactylos carnosus TaxID=1234261 RepID=A0A8S2G3E8_9BILA|nr:unnamed protein product [Didymodactylos carnosus]CAF4442930.1 unnamed protein product [Didymodactylos carnosus]
MGCEAISNGTLIRNLIESHLNPTLFKYNYTAVGDGIQVNELQINVLTDGFNFKQLTELFIIMEKFYRELLGICSLDPYFDKPNAGMYISTPICANMNSTKIEGVTSCYLIDQCNRCGNRGVCEPDKNETKCQCFHDPLNPPVGDFCDISTPPGTSVNWPAIVIGILGGIAALLCITTCCLLALALWRRRRHPE